MRILTNRWQNFLRTYVSRYYNLRTLFELYNAD